MKKRLKYFCNLIEDMQFKARTIVFAALFFIEVFIIKINVDFAYANVDLADLFKLPQDLPTFILAFILVFLILVREKIKEIKLSKINCNVLSCFLLINIISTLTFISLNSYMVKNSLKVSQLAAQYLPLWYTIAILTTLSLFFAFFRVNGSLRLLKRFKIPAFVSAVVAVLFQYSYPIIYKLWPLLSNIAAHSSLFILKIFVPEASVIMLNQNQMLSLPNFSAVIGAPCSGIEGIALFLALFTVFTLFNWSSLDKRKVPILLVLGIAGIFAINIIRVSILFLIGHFWSPELGAGVFHTNLGWILYSLYFVLLEIFTYDWIKR